MGLHVDVPSREQVTSLFAVREPHSVTLYVPTDPVSRGDAERITLRNAISEAVDRLTSGGAPRATVADLRESLEELDDPLFWRQQGRTLAVFAVPGTVRAFRLANTLPAYVGVADRLHLKPLLRSVTFPQAALVLALAQGSVRLLEIAPDTPPEEIPVPGMPASAADAAGKASIADRSPSGRIQGSEGRKIRVRQYARAVDQALRPYLNGISLPVILAAAEPTASLYRSVNSYPHLADAGIAANPETASDAELAREARTILDGLYAAELRDVHALYDTRLSQGRTTADLAEVARAATRGAIDTVLVDIETTVPGTIDEDTGVLGPADAPPEYGVVDEIARRVWATGGRVLAVRGAEVPGGGPAAAILRYALG